MKKLISIILSFILFAARACADGNGAKPSESERLSEMKIKIEITSDQPNGQTGSGSHTLTATLADNSSAHAFYELLQKGSITVSMHDYGNFEKVGSLPSSLPRNDTQITTEAGDIILYQGNQITFYYDTNSWNFTRLGKIDGVTKAELKQILGKGNVTAVISVQQ